MDGLEGKCDTAREKNGKLGDKALRRVLSMQHRDQKDPWQ